MTRDIDAQSVCTMKNKRWLRRDALDIWAGVDATTSTAPAPISTLQQFDPYFGDKTVQADVRNQATGQQAHVVHAAGYSPSIVYLGDPAQPGAVRIARIHHLESIENWIGAVVERRYRVDVAPGVDLAFVAALLTFAHEARLRAARERLQRF